MELPHIGTQCHDNTCKQLDFLPFKCNFCSKTFCQNHWTLQSHNCSNPPLDTRAPVCPVCNKVVPVPRGEDPNLRIYTHITKGCPDPGKSSTGDAYTNKCNYAKCKQKEIIMIKCKGCGQTFCIKHRLDEDHQCPSRSSSKPASKTNSPQVGRAGLAAIQRNQNTIQASVSGNVSRNRNINGLMVSGLTDDEQLALAVQMSLEEQPNPNNNPPIKKSECVIA